MTAINSLKPYVFFYGRCEEALRFYQGVFNGTYEAMRVGDVPSGVEMPRTNDERIMHASFSAPGVAFFASDGAQTQAIDPDAGNVVLSLQVADVAAGERVFNALAEGGLVQIAFAQAFWGGHQGSVVDKFGIEWMVATETQS